MSDQKKFGIIGGDMRQLFMAESIKLDGYNTYITGFEKVDNKLSFDINDLIKNSDYIILPVPVTKDFKSLNMPFSSQKIILNDNFAKKFTNKNIFCGVSKRLLETSEFWNESKIFDYTKEEEFAIKNAIPTAEGALEIAIKEFESTIHNANCLVAGYGRIGKILSEMLKKLGADVTVSARNEKDLNLIQNKKYKLINTLKISSIKDYDIIFNTIPYLIFDEKILTSNKKVLIIDLASKPGGTDFEAAKKLGIKAIHALSVPGKTAPKTAGEIIKDTIYSMIRG